MKVRKLFCLLLAALMLTLGACAGSAKAENDMYYSQESAAEAPEYGLAPGETVSSAMGNSASTPLPANRKLIRTIHIQAETEDLDALQADINDRIVQLGGYIQSKNLRNGSAYAAYRSRSLSMTIRVPADQADAFVAQLSSHSNIVSSSEDIDDVTLQYVDTESHVKALETEQARLMELLEQAKNLSDILEIQSRLTQVRYELESYASRLRTLDNQITYATIHLNVSEVVEYTPVAEETLWQRISGGFRKNLKQLGGDALDFVVWVLASSPYLIVWGGILCGGVLLVRKLAKKRPGKKPKKAEPENKE